MTQPQTWIAHAIFGTVAAILTLLLAPDMITYTAVAVGNYALGRERRDHEIKEGLKAAEWMRGWNIFAWSKDGKIDLVTFAVPPIVAAVLYHAGYIPTF